ncbi:MAG: ATP phosphoribosyltransferase regulatory subunit [Oscillospiraceae bacterium]|jgi:ATP phosphoribosyltransferase regulatory subunit|nr:ATP phosphoribosyltransferase regulatory subunit [Oscillospiraceae bacterium]
MSNLIDLLPYAEQIPLKLRAVFEQYGYKKYIMSNFEPYDLYWENRNFIKSEGIITFTAANGRLMALRPDVTTSIIKHAAMSEQPEKLYYIENVFRTDHQTKDFREIRQMGLEYIGGEQGYAEAEVVFLALQSLQTLGTDYRLNLNHMGLIEGVLEYVGAEEAVSDDIKMAIKQKNPHDIAMIAQQAGVRAEKIQFLTSFTALCGDFQSVLAQLKGFAVNETMRAAVAELEGLVCAVSAFAPSPNMQFDVSVINDMDYYNGTVFRGYIKESPSSVLSGGRYDNMMKRFGKEQCALGFGLYLGELDRAFYASPEYDADVYLYQNGFAADAVAAAVKALTEKGLRVYTGAQKEPPVRVKTVYEMTGAGAMEVAAND